MEKTTKISVCSWIIACSGSV